MVACVILNLSRCLLPQLNVAVLDGLEVDLQLGLRFNSHPVIFDLLSMGLEFIFISNYDLLEIHHHFVGRDQGQVEAILLSATGGAGMVI